MVGWSQKVIRRTTHTVPILSQAPIPKAQTRQRRQRRPNQQQVRRPGVPRQASSSPDLPRSCPQTKKSRLCPKSHATSSKPKTTTDSDGSQIDITQTTEGGILQVGNIFGPSTAFVFLLLKRWPTEPTHYTYRYRFVIRPRGATA